MIGQEGDEAKSVEIRKLPTTYPLLDIFVAPPERSFPFRITGLGLRNLFISPASRSSDEAALASFLLREREAPGRFREHRRSSLPALPQPYGQHTQFGATELHLIDDSFPFDKWYGCLAGEDDSSRNIAGTTPHLWSRNV